MQKCPGALSIDEFKGNTGGEKFNVILCDAKNKVVLDILPQRKENYLIDYFKKTRREYGFNAIGLFAVAAHLKIKRKNKYYCAEFVQELLQRAGVHNEFPNLIKPEDFLKIRPDLGSIDKAEAKLKEVFSFCHILQLSEDSENSFVSKSKVPMSIFPPFPPVPISLSSFSEYFISTE